MSKLAACALALTLAAAASACGGKSGTTGGATLLDTGGNRLGQSAPAATDTASAKKAEKAAAPKATRPAKEQALIDAYPDFVSDIADGKVLMADGSSVTWDDGKEKDFVTMLDNTDAEDMFFSAYRLPDPEPEYLEDVGRARSDALFKKMYGNSSAEVQKNLVTVEWFGDRVKFTKVNGAADSLRAVAREIAGKPELKPFLKSSGTFYWRKVRGANRLSAHSFGIAFDIAVDKSDYWLWKSGSNDELKRVKYANRIPRELVEIFQRHGFIWGGSWYHFDTMHFEFRPELLRYAELNRN